MKNIYLFYKTNVIFDYMNTELLVCFIEYSIQYKIHYYKHIFIICIN